MKRQQDISNSAALPRTAARGHRIAAAVCSLFAAVAIAPNLPAQAPPRPQKSPTPPRYEATPRSTSLPPGIGPTTTKATPHPLAGKILDPHKVPPHIGPGPIEHNTGASNTQGTTVVRGNSQAPSTTTRRR